MNNSFYAYFRHLSLLILVALFYVFLLIFQIKRIFFIKKFDFNVIYIINRFYLSLPDLEEMEVNMFLICLIVNILSLVTFRKIFTNVNIKITKFNVLLHLVKTIGRPKNILFRSDVHTESDCG